MEFRSQRLKVHKSYQHGMKMIKTLNTVDSFLTDTSVKQTPRVGPRLLFIPFI